MDKKRILIRTGNAVLAAMLSFSTVGSHIAPVMVQAQTETAGSVTVNNTGADNIVWLEELGEAKYFTFSATVTFNDYEAGQQSAALAFGNMRANVHGKIDWNNPVRLWDDARHVESVCPGPKGQENTWLQDNGIDLSQPFTLTVTVSKDGNVSYSINGIPACSISLAEDYAGGKIGLMTYSSDATFSNITLEKIEEEQPVDRSGLEALVSQCGVLSEEDYTPESWKALAGTLDQANALLAQESADQTAIDQMSVSLQDALNALQKKEEPAAIDKTKLNEAIENAKALKEEDYTSESWKGFLEALNEAKNVSADENATAEDVEKALKVLEDGQKTLVKAETTKPVGADQFANVGAAGMEITDGALVLDASGDHFAMLDSQKKPAKDFRLEADVQLLAGTGTGNEGDQMSAALVFGASTKKNPGVKWYGANVDTRRSQNADFFRVFGAGRDILSGGKVDDVDVKQPIHLSIDVRQDGSFTYSFGNTGKTMHSVNGVIENWEGGYVGLLTFCAKAAFSNVQFVDRTIEQEQLPIETDERWTNNLGESIAQGGEWTMNDKGLASNAIGKGDTFLISKMEGENFIYETDLSYQNDSGAAGLLFRFANTENGKEGYAVNVDAGSHKAKFWRWEADQAQQLISERDVEPADTYHLKVVCIDGSIQYWINDVLIANLGDFTMQKEDLGQTTIVTKGYYGLLNWNSDAIFQNTRFTVLDDTNTPSVTDVRVGSHAGTVEAKSQFFPESPTWMQYVKNDADSVFIEPEVSEGTHIVFEKDGTQYAPGEDIPVDIGTNWITMTASNGEASRTYRLNIHRFDKDSTYYNEPYRGQYHYSVKEGWANDPNGLVKYNGKYNMFYQFYDDDQWGPMHWMHATSIDLIHWNEEPVAFYPDMNGTMFSGCVAVDETNASKLFSTDKGGLIAYITVNGNGQRIKLAYSEDEGKTWKKSDKIAADWSNDSLQNVNFRDPKVFQWENKWFMVVAGGPLRIYSSDDMVNWKEESAYNDLHTECPDLYPQEVDGQVKWILSRGGRYYKVGDLKEVNGKWTYVPDEYYKDKDGVMNFGADSYAAMTYYETGFGTADHPTIPDIVELNWMNTWDDYCNQVAEKVGQKFNGTFNLHLKVGLIKDANGVYRLTQTPIQAYEKLRGEETKLSGKVGADNDLLKDFQGTSYEIVSRFVPEEGTKKVGFKVRTGDNGEETSILYDVETNTLSLDRSKSGIQISNRFSAVNSQDLSELIQRSKVSRNADGSIDLHVFVDASSVEVFANGYTAAGANQIFPLPTSRGASVIVEGDPCQADVTVYALDSVWKKEQSDLSIQSSDTEKQTMYTGKSKKLNAYILPVESDQSLVWSSSDPDVASVDADGTVHAKAPGKATITVCAKADETISRTFDVTVREDNFVTDVKDWAGDGTWTIENDELVNENQIQNAFYLSKETYEGDYDVSADVKYEKGLVNVFFASNASPFDNGAYSVQLTQDRTLRLFRFAKDGVDEESVQLDQPLNDGVYHHIEISRKGHTVTVSIDGKQKIEHEYAQTESHYDPAHVGVGLWDGKASFKNFRITKAQQQEPVDTEELKAACEEAKGIVKEDYTPDSVKALDEAYAKAVALLEKQDPSQEEVNDALKDLNAAIKGLVKKADKSKLNEAIVSANKLNGSDYTPESWKTFAEVLNEANKVSKDANALQNDVDAAMEKLTAAQKALIKAQEPKPVDTEELKAACEEAKGIVKEDYTPDSVKALDEAYAKAVAVLEKQDPSQEEVNDALKDLNAAIKGLVKAQQPEQPEAVDKSKLNEAIESANKLKESDYTPDSWKAFIQALNKAKDMANKEDAVQKDVDAVHASLANAQKALTKAQANTPASADKTKLEESIKKAEGLKKADYTEKSWNKLLDALKQAKEVAQKSDAAQDEIDQAEQLLNDTIKALVRSTGNQSNGSTSSSTKKSSANTSAMTGMSSMIATAGASLLGIVTLLKKRNRK